MARIWIDHTRPAQLQEKRFIGGGREEKEEEEARKKKGKRVWGLCLLLRL